MTEEEDRNVDVSGNGLWDIIIVAVFLAVVLGLLMWCALSFLEGNTIGNEKTFPGRPSYTGPL